MRGGLLPGSEIFSDLGAKASPLGVKNATEIGEHCLSTETTWDKIPEM